MENYAFIKATYGRILCGLANLAFIENSSIYSAQNSVVQSLYGVLKVDKVFETYI